MDTGNSLGGIRFLEFCSASIQVFSLNMLQK